MQSLEEIYQQVKQESELRGEARGEQRARSTLIEGLTRLYTLRFTQLPPDLHNKLQKIENLSTFQDLMAIFALGSPEEIAAALEH